MASASKQDKKSKKSKEVIEIRGHHLIFLYYQLQGLDRGTLDKEAIIRTQISFGYGKKNAVKTWKLINMLRNNEVRVKITRDLDNMCSADYERTKCKRKDKEGDCAGDEDTLDKEVALYYHLKPGKIYSSRKVINSIRKK